MSLKKIRLLPDQYLFHQGDEGDTAYLLISGTVGVEIGGKSVGKISDGEIFGELSLILEEYDVPLTWFVEANIASKTNFIFSGFL